MRRFITMAALCFAFAGLVFAEDKGTVFDMDGLKSTTPATWKKEEAKGMRSGQFKIPKAEGDEKDGELTVFSFGGGSGGSAKDNMERWKKQFKAPAADKAKTEKLKVGKIEVATIELEGTYLDNPAPMNPNSKPVERAGYKAIYVYFPTDNKINTMRFVGPAKTIDGQKKAFMEWVKNFK